MQGLSDFTPISDTVGFPGGGSFAVRGLALEDFAVLIRAHYPAMSSLFDQYVSEAALEKADRDTGGSLNIGDMKGVVLNALQMAPGLVGDVIARAADETENPHKARMLPLGVQIDAVSKVVALTLEAEGGMEKLLETISTLPATLSKVAVDRSP